MAKVTIIVEDVGDGGEVQLSHCIDRSGDEQLGLMKFPATSAMIIALTMIKLFNRGELDKHMDDIVDHILNEAGLTPQQVEAAKRAAEVS